MNAREMHWARGEIINSDKSRRLMSDLMWRQDDIADLNSQFDGQNGRWVPIIESGT